MLKLESALDKVASGDLVGAVDILSELVKTEPTSSHYFHYGFCLARLGKHQEGLDNYLRAIENQPEWALPYLYAAIEFRHLGNFGDAFKHFQKHLLLEPKSIEGYLNYGDSLMAFGCPMEAMRIYAEAVEIDPQVPIASLLNVFDNCKKLSSASNLTNSFRTQSILAYTGRVLLDSEKENIQEWGRSDLLSALEWKKAGRYDKAYEHFEKHLLLAPDSVVGRREFALLIIDKAKELRNSGNLGEALKKYQYHSKIFPEGNDDRYVYIADLFEDAIKVEESKVDDAFDYIKKHFDYVSIKAEQYLIFGERLYISNKLSLALDMFLRAYERDPGIPEGDWLAIYKKILEIQKRKGDDRSLRTDAISIRLVDSFFETVVKRLSKNMFWGDRLLTLDKSMGFLSDPVFATANSERLLEVYDQFSPPSNIEWRLNTLVWAGRHALKLEGDFVECGVFKGDMSWVLARCLDFSKVNKTLYLYDSFSGFSADGQTVEDYPNNPGFLDFANGIYSADSNLAVKVAKRFSQFHNVRVIPGYVPDSFSKGIPEKVAYLHLDLNSPGAEIAALDVLFDRIVPGGIIVFDDYGWLDFRKQKEQEDIWFEKRGLFVMELPTGQGLVIKR